MMKEYGYEYEATLDEKLWKRTVGKVTHEEFRNAICLRSGRDALKVIAREYNPTVIFIPALACASMVLPFKMYGHNVLYYKLKKDYSIDLEFLEKNIQGFCGTRLFIYMDYFGLRAISDDALQRIRDKYSDLVFIEDRTHNLIWKRNNVFKPDYIIASLRKWVNVPDGGLLWTKNNLRNNTFAEDTFFSSIRLKAQCMRREYFITGDENIKLQYRKIFSRVSDILDEDKEPSRMSRYSYEIATRMDWDEIRNRRKENADALISILKKASVRLIQQTSGLSDLYVAFMIKGRDYKQSQLSKIGIFNTIIWPLTVEQKQICAISKFTEEHMLAAPCDQRYSVSDMEYIGEKIVRIINE